ncbi:hypothetical protein FRX31_031399 [Thalictrum thalictroides]|uniref:Uncharacterized protein n=1 Tax=Thalictrum thalictroides TaxID=46969 RepID=A0A7J6V1Z3_THATH|nr:hypothetical protein FRX31_031399 [Thalictrum thalictroides]
MATIVRTGAAGLGGMQSSRVNEAAVQRVKTTVWAWQEISKNNLQTRKDHSFNELRVGWRQTFGSTGTTTQAGPAQLNGDIAPGDSATNCNNN